MKSRIIRGIDRLLRTSYFAKFNNSKIGYHKTFPKTKIGSRIFIHVPRTGGTSINYYMQNYNKTHSDKLLYIEPHYIPNFDLPITAFRYYTVVRNPVERAISYYFLQLRDKNQPYRYLAMAGFERFVNKCWEVNNIFVRYFANAIEKSIIDDSDVHTAFQNLSKFEKVIDFNRISEFFCQEFLVTNVGFPHLNKTESKSINAEMKSLIKEKNTYDIKLYDLVMENLIWKSQ